MSPDDLTSKFAAAAGVRAEALLQTEYFLAASPVTLSRTADPRACADHL